MKPLLSIILCALLGSAQAQVDSATKASQPIFTVVERPPQFQGGMAQMDKYIRQNIRYPQAAKGAKRRGTVYVSFVVTDSGHIQDVKNRNSVHPELDAEAVRLVQEMPPWEPGQQNGRPVAVRYNIPIRFTK